MNIERVLERLPSCISWAFRNNEYFVFDEDNNKIKIPDEIAEERRKYTNEPSFVDGYCYGYNAALVQAKKDIMKEHHESIGIAGGELI